MTVTVIVEPNPGGHRFQLAANVGAVAARTDDVVLLTSVGAREHEEFATFVAGTSLRVVEVFAGFFPSAAAVADAVAAECAAADVRTVVVADGDQLLKRWWRDAPRRLPTRPRVVFFLTRYPARLALTDRLGWAHRVAKSGLCLLAIGRGVLHRVGGFAGREERAAGWLVKRVPDPAICGYHARDRAAIRAGLGLPASRRLVGVLGAISDRKNLPMVTAAVLASSPDADVLAAGSFKPDVQQWLDAQPDAVRRRIVVRPGFLSNDELDRCVAACDVVAIAQNNNGPSGIMGKALAARVPVVSAGSAVRARELRATGGGLDAELDAEAIAAALRRLYCAEALVFDEAIAAAATGEAFGEKVLGVGGNFQRAESVTGRYPARVNPRVRAVVRYLVRKANTPFAVRRFRHALAAAPRPVRLEIGGLRRRPGWLVTNVNAVARNYLDATARWPMDDGTVSHVYADNVIEHLTLDAGRAMLAEAYRCLEPGGAIRLVTPDIGKHVQLYLAGAGAVDDEVGASYRALGLVVEHPVDLIRIPIGSFGHHLGYVYDFATLEAELTRAGFHAVKEYPVGESGDPAFAGLDQRTDEAGAQVAVEARR